MIPKPDNVDLPENKEWEDMSAELRYYYRNKNEWTGRVGKRKQKLREWVRSVAVDAGCDVCGEDHPAVLRWHHINPEEKDRTPIKLAKHGCSKERIKEEMDKCRVLCANCHWKHHWNEEHGRKV